MVFDLSSEGLRSDMYANPHRESARVVGSQDAPIMQGWSDASVRQKIRGIVDQVRLDLSRGHRHTADELLRERFKASRIAVDDDRVAALALSLRAVDHELTRREEEARRAAEEAADEGAPAEGAPDGQAPDRQAPDGQAPDRQAPDEQAPHRQAPDRQAPDEQAPHKQAPHEPSAS